MTMKLTRRSLFKSLVVAPVAAAVAKCLPKKPDDGMHIGLTDTDHVAEWKNWTCEYRPSESNDELVAKMRVAMRRLELKPPRGGAVGSSGAS